MIKINNAFVENNELMQLIAECKPIAEERQKPWQDKYENLLKTWLQDRSSIYDFNNLDVLMDSVFSKADAGQEIKGVPVSEEKMAAAQRLRRVHRLGKIFEPSSNQIAAVVPGIHQLPPDQLLPLDHYWSTPSREQRQRWQQTTSGRYVQLKPKGELNETRVLAFGNPYDPSMLYWQGSNRLGDPLNPLGRQLGHRYQASLPIYGINDSKRKTYGGKKRTTGEYKVKGMSDGHAIQAQNNQRNLDPASGRLGADSYIENMYWENESYGQKIRQKYFETYALKNTSWLMQVNEYSHVNVGFGTVETHGRRKTLFQPPEHVETAHTVHIKAVNVCSAECGFYYVESSHPPFFPNLIASPVLDSYLPLLIRPKNRKTVWVYGLKADGGKQLPKLSQEAANVLSHGNFITDQIYGPFQIPPVVYGDIVAKQAHAQIGYWRFDNRREADYSDLEERIQKGRYKDRDIKSLDQRSTSLGIIPNSDHKNKVSPPHADANRLTDARLFPTAQIVRIDTLATNPEEQFRETKQSVAGYRSPPGTPHYLSPREEEIRDFKEGEVIGFEGQELTNANERSSFITRIDYPPGICRINILTIQHNKLWRKRQEHKEEKDGKSVTPTFVIARSAQQESPPSPTHVTGVIDSIGVSDAIPQPLLNQHAEKDIDIELLKEGLIDHLNRLLSYSSDFSLRQSFRNRCYNWQA